MCILLTFSLLVVGGGAGVGRSAQTDCRVLRAEVSLYNGWEALGRSPELVLGGAGGEREEVTRQARGRCECL